MARKRPIRPSRPGLTLTRPERTRPTRTRPSGTRLSGKRSTGTRLTGTRLRRARLRRARLRSARARRTRATRASASRTVRFRGWRRTRPRLRSCSGVTRPLGGGGRMSLLPGFPRLIRPPRSRRSRSPGRRVRVARVRRTDRA
ncbi:pentapeptide repeat-containing protein [Actinoplanes sp. CA-051413]|uniref:pentapeptide repeat-containing protein n=1 Tax=Actinoplanes sp. CA-051413 TaxID=3239899 RepID=UPI003D99466E